MHSLKKYLDRLARHMGSTPATLYERQRQLVRLKLLTPPKRVGPGGGIRANPETVATLLLAWLSTDNLSEVAAGVRQIERLHPRQQNGLCPLTKANSFGDALVRILSDPQLAVQVESITFNRTERTAKLNFTTQAGPMDSCLFGGAPDDRPLAEIWAVLGGRLLKMIADDLKTED